MSEPSDSPSETDSKTMDTKLDPVPLEVVCASTCVVSAAAAVPPGEPSKDDGRVRKPRKFKNRKARSDDKLPQCDLGAHQVDLQKRDNYTIDDLRGIADVASRDNVNISPIPLEVLRLPPQPTVKRAIGKHGHMLKKPGKHSAWNLAIDSPTGLVPGQKVLADVGFGTMVPERSLGIVAQVLEASLVQVVFKSFEHGSLHCIVVPIERLCTPARDNDADHSESS